MLVGEALSLSLQKENCDCSNVACLPSAVIAFQPDTLFSSRIQSLCPTITGDVCCTVDQFDTLHQQVQQVNTLIAEEVHGLCA